MKSFLIDLSIAENVKKFVDSMGKYAFDVDLRAGRYVVDAKSILGIFSLDLSKPITIEIYAEDLSGIMEDIKPFLV